MIAALPMYDRAETAAANDALWALVREALEQAPAELTRGGDLMEIWTSPDLVLAQTCNLPYRLHLAGKVQLVGCPDYKLPDCPPGFYNSVLVARKDDPRALTELLNARAVVNDPHSQSGYAALWFHAKSLGQTPNFTLKSGSHRDSVIAVAEGRADIAAIDAMSWRLIRRHDAQAGLLRDVCRTAPTPALPFITGLSRDRASIAQALRHAISDLPPEVRDAISLFGLINMNESQILGLPTPPTCHIA